MMGSLVRFAVVGLITTGLSYILVTIVARLGAHYLIAATIGWGGGVAIGYVLHRQFTFLAGPRPTWREARAFGSGSVLQLILGLLGYVVLIDGIGLDLTAAFLVNLTIVSAFSFLFMRLIVFRQARSFTSMAVRDS